jgi:hypothetical protein
MVELGLRAEALLGSDTFKFIVDFLSDSYANNILQSSPTDTEARETNYHLHQALQHIVAQLGAFQARAHELVRQGQQEDNE